MGSHLEPQLIERIQRGEYMDFGKLVPKDRIMIEEYQRLEMIIRNGRTYYVLVSDTTSNNSFQKWEQAFRVFANIYAKSQAHPSAELIEYNQKLAL